MKTQYIWNFFHGLGRTRQLLSPYNRDVPLIGGGPRWIWRRYLLARAMSLMAAPTRGRRWLMSYIDAAVHRGILDECRRSVSTIVTLSPQPPLPQGEGVGG
jgi:hypothetical protein